MRADSHSKRRWRAWVVWTISSLVTLTAVLWARGGARTPVRFVAERIILRPGGDQLRVTGLYTYKNPLPIPVALRIRYPFPVDAGHPYPTAILVQEADGKGHGLGPLPFERRSDAVDFDLAISGNSQVRILVDYTQPCPTRTGTYIVTTTRRWGKPIDHAEFVLLMQPGEDLLRVAGPFQFDKELGDRARLTFSATRFWPDRQIRVAWRSRPRGVSTEADMSQKEKSHATR